ncbi:MAG: c-type cytochrome [Vicinamibacterales bacterium]
MSTNRLLVLVSASIVSFGSVAVARPGAPKLASEGGQQPSKSVNDGVYTTDQAARGERVFNAKCGSCHAPGRFMGEDLFKAWADKPLFELFEIARSSMPEDNPGTLPVQEYADVITYFLQLNKYPAGSAELIASEEALRAIMFERPK